MAYVVTKTLYCRDLPINFAEKPEKLKLEFEIFNRSATHNHSQYFRSKLQDPPFPQ